jgi:hypothetical protein
MNLNDENNPYDRNELIFCLECNKPLQQITQKHLNKCCGITVEMYKQKHVGCKLRTDWHKYKIQQLNSRFKSGDNSPMKNPKHFKKMLESQLLAVQNADYRKRVSERQKLKNNNPNFSKNWIGRHHTLESINKIRDAQILQRKRKGLSNLFKPNFNIKACELFDLISSLTNTDIQHGMNVGEYNIVELGYWVDGYDKENNIVYEFDEPRHFNKDGTLKAQDVIRQNNIEKYLDCKFIRLNESHIEHIDSMRDVVDKLIEITKTNGSSKIYFE